MFAACAVILARLWALEEDVWLAVAAPRSPDAVSIDGELWIVGF